MPLVFKPLELLGLTGDSYAELGGRGAMKLAGPYIVGPSVYTTLAAGRYPRTMVGEFAFDTRTPHEGVIRPNGPLNPIMPR